MANESIHGSRAAVWHSENQVADGLGFLKELKFVFRKDGRKKRDYALWETRVIRVRQNNISSFDYVHTDFEAAFRC